MVLTNVNVIAFDCQGSTDFIDHQYPPVLIHPAHVLIILNQCRPDFTSVIATETNDS